MADVKISQLPNLTTPDAADLLVIVDGTDSTTKNITMGDFVNGYATESYVDTAVAGLVDSAPTVLDTLNELAAALGDDPSFATTVANDIGTKWTQDNTKISNWDTAFGWGNHATAGYVDVPTLGTTLSGYVTTTTPASSGNVSITASNYVIIDSDGNGQIEIGRNSGIGNVIIGNFSNGTAVEIKSGLLVDGGNLSMGAQGDIQLGSGGVIYISNEQITPSKVGQWDDAYDWGDHASAGYLLDGSDVNPIGVWEVTATPSTPGPTETYMVDTSHHFVHTAPAVGGNWTANLTSSSAPFFAISSHTKWRSKFTFVVVQGISTQGLPITLQMDGASQNVLWEGGTPPSAGIYGSTDVVEFDVIWTGGNMIALGKCTNYS